MDDDYFSQTNSEATYLKKAEYYDLEKDKWVVIEQSMNKHRE